MGLYSQTLTGDTHWSSSANITALRRSTIAVSTCRLTSAVLDTPTSLLEASDESRTRVLHSRIDIPELQVRALMRERRTINATSAVNYAAAFKVLNYGGSESCKELLETADFTEK
ncbi:unnamed protein product [Nippostrongylus brasiliensis]|uniref:ANK_REP_REGION domain-containing protein n=1 Tax=Nippostrongylus brasiliensis TaxID=27835 RepID=A0A0N4XWV5_NIPBR|nr:unnamed protein product [Nippostrongylus brasiliensis]